MMVLSTKEIHKRIDRTSLEWQRMKIKPFSPNQLKALALSNAPFNLWEGSIRSGKTFLSIAWLINKIKSLPQGNGMILGQTSETIERNFLNDFMNILGEGNYSYKQGRYIDVYYYAPDEFGNETRNTRRMYVVGARDKGAIKRIRGATLMIAYIDEVTLMPKEVFDELIGRLSSKSAKLLATTNPDSPNHWILKNYVENAESKRDWRRFRFLLDDNLSLDLEYIERIKRQYRGIPARYQRMIEGKWVLAEGVIYQVFDKNRHVVKRGDLPKEQPRRLFIGSDYGVENPTVFLIIGEYMIKGKKVYYVLNEYYYSGRESMKTKTTRQFARDFIKFIKGYRIKDVVIDPSAKALITELNQNEVKREAGSFYNVIEAKNSVLDGIQSVANLIEAGMLYVSEDCKMLIEEFGLYMWNPKAQERGEDSPIKDNDHCLDALRYAIHTLIGDIANVSGASGW